MARIVNAASIRGGKIRMYSKQPSACQYGLWYIKLLPGVLSSKLDFFRINFT